MFVSNFGLFFFINLYFICFICFVCCLLCSSWSATIQTATQDATSVTDSALDESEELCLSAIENEFGTGSCYICDEGEIKVYQYTVSVPTTSDAAQMSSSTENASSTDPESPNPSGSGGVSGSDGATNIDPNGALALWCIVLAIGACLNAL